MTPQQAIEILDKVTSNVQLNRQEHTTVVQALQVLQGLIPKAKKTSS